MRGCTPCWAHAESSESSAIADHYFRDWLSYVTEYDICFLAVLLDTTN